MSPRRYELGRRQVATDETRAKILDAARDLLTTGREFNGFTIDAVAKKAGVARMTVYYQFESKIGLLEALCDDLASRGGIDEIPAAFQQADPMQSLEAMLVAFSHFWEANRQVLRRLYALATLDPDFQQVFIPRAGRRKQVFSVLLQRILATKQFKRKEPLSEQSIEELVDTLVAITGFQVFDDLAGPDRPLDAVVPRILQLATTALKSVPT